MNIFVPGYEKKGYLLKLTDISYFIDKTKIPITIYEPFSEDEDLKKVFPERSERFK